MENILNTVDTKLIFFIIIQLVNVIISTIKSILTVNGSRSTAAVINAVSYSVAAATTKMLTEQSFTVAIIVAFMTNLTGVYAAKWLIDKTRKEKLWVIMATVRTADQTDVEIMLRRQNIGYTLMRAQNDRILVNIFSYSKEQSKTVRDILIGFDAPYSIMESKPKL